MSASFITLSEFTSTIAGYDPNCLSVQQAQTIIRDFVKPTVGTEQIMLASSIGRVLASTVISPINVPPYDNSAMDGYAIRSSDLIAHQAVRLSVIGTVRAGDDASIVVKAGSCVRIMTGAVLPACCDTVIPQEHVQSSDGDTITVGVGTVSPGDNRRQAGEDLQAGLPALVAGTILRPAHLGLLASLGLAEVSVQRRLRVAFFSTGSELRGVHETLDPGCIYDSNRYALLGMLTRLGCEPIDMGIVQDEPEALRLAFKTACDTADVVITSGGVSAGVADYTKKMMAQLGDVHFWKINMRPGRPFAFGRINANGTGAYLIGLPGNPVAAMISFYFLARIALLQMMGAVVRPLPIVAARTQTALFKKPGRTEYQRGILSSDALGQAQVNITGAQGSGILRSMCEANCIVILDEPQGDVMAGDLVNIVLFDGLV
jgi:molybdopterin molybdotransferase